MLVWAMCRNDRTEFIKIDFGEITNFVKINLTFFSCRTDLFI